MQEIDTHDHFMAQLNSLQIKNPLIYESISYEQSEWDNIPQIITKMCLNMDKYLSSTIKYISMITANDK